MNDTGDKVYSLLCEKNPLTDAMSRLGFFAYENGTQKKICNALWRTWGYDEKDMNNQRLREICHPDDREKVDRFICAMESGARDIQKAIFRIRNVEGRWVWICHSGTTVSRGRAGESELYIGLDTDLTDFKETEERLRSLTAKSEIHAKETESLLNAASIITSSLQVDELVRLILEQAKTVVPYDKASVQIIQNGGLELIGGDGFGDMPAVIGMKFPYPEQGSMSTLAIKERRAVVCGDVTRDWPGFILAEKKRPTRSWMGIPLVAQGRVFGLLSFNHYKENFYNDNHIRLASGFAVHVAVALENARLYENTRKLAMEDALMGIGNRHHFDIQGAVMFESARRKKTVLSLAMIDLDYFKAINDTFGHDVGDSVLKEIGRLCRQEFRITDLECRYGGEEIVLLFPETDIEAAVMLSERLRTKISELEFSPVGRGVTISIGIASEIPKRTSSLSNLLKCADSALYEAKKNGRNRIEVYKGT